MFICVFVIYKAITIFIKNSFHSKYFNKYSFCYVVENI